MLLHNTHRHMIPVQRGGVTPRRRLRRCYGFVHAALSDGAMCVAWRAPFVLSLKQCRLLRLNAFHITIKATETRLTTHTLFSCLHEHNMVIIYKISPVNRVLKSNNVLHVYCNLLIIYAKRVAL